MLLIAAISAGGIAYVIFWNAPAGIPMSGVLPSSCHDTDFDGMRTIMRVSPQVTVCGNRMS